MTFDAAIAAGYQLFYLPHLCRVIQCLEAGNPVGAASWMERDLGEIGVSADQMPDPETLELISWEHAPGGRCVAYKTHADKPELVIGAGI